MGMTTSIVPTVHGAFSFNLLSPRSDTCDRLPAHTPPQLCAHPKAPRTADTLQGRVVRPLEQWPARGQDQPTDLVGSHPCIRANASWPLASFSEMPPNDDARPVSQPTCKACSMQRNRRRIHLDQRFLDRTLAPPIEIRCSSVRSSRCAPKHVRQSRHF
jgi:hypothetical protein